MTNRLAGENSPYLLQHADNPVDWYPWGEQALEKARQSDRPIFLSIGYAACHWCHVMAHESFEDPQIAAIMNEFFVNIKVDREERPDLDGIYMSAVVAMTGQGGWPMSVFLTPAGAPFYSGTYFPPSRKYGMPSFKEVLLAVKEAWQKERDRIEASGNEIAGQLASSVQVTTPGENINPGILDQITLRLAQSYDWESGGWGKAPKFPQPMAIELLLTRASQGDKLALQVAQHALDAMSAGGMYDVIGGGFCRYSTDNSWLVPHFEKMLYDNAQLARAYLHAYLITGKVSYLKVCTNTLDFIRRELFDEPNGGFFSSLDADSEGEEGKYYIWTLPEITAVLSTGSEDKVQDLALFTAAYDLKEMGNFEGRIILQRKVDSLMLSRQFNLAEHEIELHLDGMHRSLLQVRERRVHPGLDDKVLVSWNALTLIVFAEAARYLDRVDYLEISRKNAEFITRNLFEDGRLLRSWRAGKALHKAYLEDYAALILGLLSLYQSDPDTRWYSFAESLALDMREFFEDQHGGFFDTPVDQPYLIYRPRDLQDNATPSGSSLAALALLQLAAYSGRQDWRDKAEGMLVSIQNFAASHPTAFAQWAQALDFALASIKEVAIVGDPGLPSTQDLLKVLWSTYRPHVLAAISGFQQQVNEPELLNGRSPLNGLPTAYVCERFNCKQPVNIPEELTHQLLEV